jgi:hypothetical protein
MSLPLPALAAAGEAPSWAMYAVFAIVAIIVILLLLHEVLGDDAGSESRAGKPQSGKQPGKRYASRHGRGNASTLRRNG